MYNLNNPTRIETFRACRFVAFPQIAYSHNTFSVKRFALIRSGHICHWLCSWGAVRQNIVIFISKKCRHLSFLPQFSWNVKKYFFLFCVYFDKFYIRISKKCVAFKERFASRSDKRRNSSPLPRQVRILRSAPLRHICRFYRAVIEERHWQSHPGCNTIRLLFWGISSAGRALDWQSRGQGFEPPTLHQDKKRSP